jgi:hypothetical protein
MPNDADTAAIHWLIPRAQEAKRLESDERALAAT